jgi:hypothetical protein
MNYEDITTKTDIIINNLHFLYSNVSKIKKKISSINKIYKQLQSNKILINDPSNCYLTFQKNILKNEAIYYKNLYDLILDKYFNEIYELSEYIIMILISLNKIEIDTDHKTFIFNKMIKIKKDSNINYAKLNEIITVTINNLKLIDEFIKLFDKYINRIVTRNFKANFHSNNYEMVIEKKKDTILLEYNKYCEKFIKIIDYFKECSDSIINQIDKSKLLGFFLNPKIYLKEK